MSGTVGPVAHDQNGAVLQQIAPVVGDCAWCDGGTLGHPCEMRDYWLDVEDSER